MECQEVKYHKNKQMKSVNKLMILLITLIGFVSCEEKDNSNTSENYSSEATTEVTTESINSGSSSTSSNSNSTYHTDSRYKYESRTGSSGNFEYNYYVDGTDENGNSISGNVDMQGKYGSGTITDDDGEEKDVDVEWTGYGTMEAIDDDGNSYDLEVE